MKVHEAVAAALRSNGVETIYGLMGDANMLIITDYLRDQGGRFIPTAHESSAVSMADGHARTTGEIGVCSLTHGPALTNGLTALVEAVRARTSLLLLTGRPPSRFGHGQSLDIEGLCDLSGALYERVFGGSTPRRDVTRALSRALAERRPVVLDVPYDLLAQECTEASAGSARRLHQLHSAPSPSPDDVDLALGLALSARRPVVLAGRGAVTAGAKEDLVELAAMLGAPLATSLLAKDYFHGHPDNLGICGNLGTALTTEVVASSDCVLAFGARLNRFTADDGHLIGSDQRVVQCDIDPASIGQFTPVEIGILGDARATAAAMVQRLREHTDEPRPSAYLQSLRQRLATTKPYAFEDLSTDSTVDLRTAMERISQMLPPDRGVVTDVGRFIFTAWRHLRVSDPRDFIHTTNFASIGLGLSTAIGAAVARPDRTTLAVVGDGGFMMNAQELHAVVRNDARLVILVVNDGAYGAEWESLGAAGVDPEYSRTRWPDFVTMAAATGVEAVAVRNLAELDALAPRLVDPSGPLLVDLRIDPSLDIRP
ncbi:putative acetolactate synthase [Nostocoides japonicum T1-X7]|uniref:Putative acetolactate synthase n=1 Tax=Nostocoides japonicum T1-X7 TaxID=1194083 RepID=A0A077M293_9MICO|nr:thiamine pyrophosphate-binding protein [Tetrasphaera japonica]CCH79157.1 putative acetolactate synthase [Tetrasphaera japonica T1-X7]